MKDIEPLLKAIIELIDSRYTKLAKTHKKNYKVYNSSADSVDKMIEVNIELKGDCNLLNEFSYMPLNSLIERILLIEKAVGINLIISKDKNQ